MSKIETVACDICGIHKKEVNHWFILFHSPANNSSNQEAAYHGCIAIYGYDKDLANKQSAIHICGQECLQKKVLELSVELFI